MWVVEWFARGTNAGSLWLSESVGKTHHTISHSLSISLSIRGGARVVDALWVSISSLVLTSGALTFKFSAVSFALVEGS